MSDGSLGFRQVLLDVKPEATCVAAPVDTEYPLTETVQVVSLILTVERLLQLAG